MFRLLRFNRMLSDSEIRDYGGIFLCICGVGIEAKLVEIGLLITIFLEMEQAQARAQGPGPNVMLALNDIFRLLYMCNLLCRRKW